MARTISKATLTTAIVAILAGLVVAFAVRAYLAQPPAKPTPPAPPPIRVPVATTDLPAGRLIAPGDIGTLSLSRERFAADPRFKGKRGVMMSAQQIVHRRLKVAVKQEQPFLLEDLYLQGSGPSLSEDVGPGYRAIPLRVPHTHEGRVQPGDWVDVVFRVQPRAAKAGQPAIPEKTVTLLEHLKVLEVVGPSGPDTTDPRRRATTSSQTGFSVVTLAVPVGQSDVLAAVDGRGELWLVTSPDKGSEQANAPPGSAPKPATLAELLGIQPPVPPFETAIYRRGRVQINRFVDGKLLSRGEQGSGDGGQGSGVGEQGTGVGGLGTGVGGQGSGVGGQGPGSTGKGAAPAERPGGKGTMAPAVKPLPPAGPDQGPAEE
jgi:Flp pilus assembly protein CpaB